MATMRANASDVKGRAQVETERVKRHRKEAVKGLTPVKTYLLAYNVVSFGLWLTILSLTVQFLLTPRSTLQTTSSAASAASTSFFAKLFGSSSASTKVISHLPQPVLKAINHFRGAYDYKHLGTLVKWTQTLAILEIIHAGLGWVRSPVGTTAGQIFSRLWAVWGVVETAPEARSNPLYTTMVLAWSITEVVRYSFYASSILGKDFYFLNWLRYTTFLPLYPIGASSEAFLSFSTLPPLSTLPVPSFISSLIPVRALIEHLPSSARKALIKTSYGRHLLWKLTKAGVKGKVGVNALIARWGVMEYARFGLFFFWWPALYILYTYMLGQRRKFFRQGRTVGARKTQ